MTYTVYALADANDKLAIRYVGCCLQRRVQMRLWKHKCSSSDRSNQVKKKWIASLKAVGKSPVLIILESSISKSRWEEREKYWIHYCKKLGCNLTNLTDGGKGPNGSVKSEYTKNLHRQFRHSDSAKRAIKQALTGKPKSEEHKKNLSESKKGKPLSEKQKRAIADAIRKNPKCMARYRKGESNGRAILTENIVRRIRLDSGKLSHQQQANKYGVCRSAVKRIITGKSWSHVV